MSSKAFLACASVCSIFSSIAVGVASLAIWNANQHSPCLGTTDLVNFHYMTWLLANGIYTLGMCFTTLSLLLTYIWLMNKGSEAQTAAALLLSFLALCASIFQVAWYVVGAILYFQEVNRDCPSGHPLHDFALALFVIQTLNVASYVSINISVAKASTN